MSLADEVNERRREIRTDGYSMSVSEWASLYENKEIDIHPEFQRFYRWTDAQKTDLIESILLGIPIPPIFVNQRDDGVWDVVDGLQRLSTIYEFLGILRDENNNPVEPLRLGATKYLPSLDGVIWQSTDSSSKTLPDAMRLVIKRSKISVSIILKESDKNAKYDLFQRLNTGGSHLSPQEVRNCVLVMLNKDFFLWIKDLSEYENFQECIALSDRPLSEAYDVELVLRFIIFALIDEKSLTGLGDVGVYVTDKMRELATKASFPKKKWESLFRNTFDLISQELSDSAFKRFSTSNKKFMGGFLLSQYEVVAYGIAYNLNKGNNLSEIASTAAKIWSDERYTNWSGSGVTATRRLPRIIPFGRQVFSK